MYFQKQTKGIAAKSRIRTAAAAIILAAAGVPAGPALADIVHNDDVIANFSMCIGTDCVFGEGFAFDVLRLKENRMRLHFDDTSATGFPGNDWRIAINDFTSGGDNYFAIEDSTAIRQVFRINAGAPANALYVDSSGQIGIGTSVPAAEIEIKSGDSPGIRLQQDGSSGFTAQTWELAGNEANFFVSDITGGETFPFRIIPGADNGAFIVDSDNEVGIGMNGLGDRPDSALHVRDADGSSALTLEGTMGSWQVVSRASDGEMAINDRGTTGPDFVFKTADSAANTAWEFVHRADDGLGFNISTSPGADMILSNTGNLTVLGTVTSSGPTCGSGCDEVFDPAYDLPSIEEHAEAMYANRHLPAVGPTRPDEPVNLTEHMGNMLNELEKAHIYIAQLESEKKALGSKVKLLEDRVGALESLKSRLAELENLLAE